MIHSDTPETQIKENVEVRLFEEPRPHFKSEKQLTTHRILLSKVGGVKKMISCFLEGCQHEDALLHLGQAEPGDPQDLPLYGAEHRQV